MSSPKSTSPSNKMYYKLTAVSGQDAYDSISDLTNGFDQSHKIAPDFAQNLETVLSNSSEVLTGFLIAPKNEDITKQVIGKDGCYFHKTTNETGIYFIWHNRSSGRFEFWGEKFKLIKALNLIKWRIDTVTQRMADSKTKQ